MKTTSFGWILVGSLIGAGTFAFAQDIQLAAIPNSMPLPSPSLIMSPSSWSEKIQPGMTRAEVEQLLSARDGGPQSISSTRYFDSGQVVEVPQDHGVIIEVPYDQTGGTWALDNHVNGPVVIRSGFRSSL